MSSKSVAEGAEAGVCGCCVVDGARLRGGSPGDAPGVIVGDTDCEVLDGRRVGVVGVGAVVSGATKIDPVLGGKVGGGEVGRREAESGEGEGDTVDS